LNQYCARSALVATVRASAICAIVLADLSYCPPEQRPAVGRQDFFRELRKAVGDVSEEELLGLLEFFHVVAAERASEARAALAAGDLETLRRAGHTLRSMGAGIGAWELSGVASRLEDWAGVRLEEPQPIELEEAREMVSIIEGELSWIRASIGSDRAR